MKWTNDVPPVKNGYRKFSSEGISNGVNYGCLGRPIFYPVRDLFRSLRVSEGSNGASGVNKRRKILLGLVLLLLLFPLVSHAKVEVYFNSQQCLDDVLIEGFRKAEEAAREGKEASIDIFIFSFTSLRLGEELLRMARDNPKLKIRILADLSQLERGEYHVTPDIEDIISGRMENYKRVAEGRTSYIEDELEREEKFEKTLNWLVVRYRRKAIPNIEIRYKWYPAFSWNWEKKAPDYDHFHPTASILHHKAAIINGEILLVGSYNWSESAEIKNLENLMLFSGGEEEGIVEDFKEEFLTLWRGEAKSGPECRGLRDRIFRRIIREQEKEK